MVEILVKWDPIFGTVVPDGRVAPHVDYILYHAAKRATPYTCSVGNEALVNEFRVRLVRGEIPEGKLVFIVDEEKLPVDSMGNPSRWPKGFCELTLKQLNEIIGSKRK